jgi:hypothetical protein
MTPAAPSRTTLAGLLLAGAWLGSAGVAAAQGESGEADASTTTTVPPTTSTVPPTTSTTALQAILSGKDPAAVAYESYNATKDQPPPPAEGPLDGDAAPADPVEPEQAAAVASSVPGLLGPETGWGVSGGTAGGGDAGELALALPTTVALNAIAPFGQTGDARDVTTGDGSIPGSIPGPAAAAAAATPAPTPHGSGDMGPAPTSTSASALPAGPDGATAVQAANPNGTGITGQAENPERGPPTTIATGDATSTGNRSSTTIEQTNIVIVTEEGPVSISTAYNPDTGVGRVNGTLPGGDAFSAGVPDAVAGLRSSSLSSGGTGNGAARIDTGDANATGNDSETTINQTNLVVVLTDNTHLDMDQTSNVDNLGSANAATGSNTATGGSGTGDGSAAITTGDANATGNHSTTTINQTNVVVITGSDSSVNVDQSADVDNIGVANATTGDNAALGGGTGSSGTAVVTTGDATATGNASTTTITQKNTAVVTGDRSSVTASQQADVTNMGTATARTGSNTATGGTGEGEGSAIVDTGNATATGNLSTTTVVQSGAAVTLGQDSWADLSQSTHVDNVGSATADSGDNAALGQAA